MSDFKLSQEQIKFLKQKAHHLKPIVTIGNNGLTEGVLAEIEVSIKYHELIKVKINCNEKELYNDIVNAIIRESNIHFVQTIGRITIFYKASENKKIVLPKLSNKTI